VAALCDRVAIMKQGAIVECASTAEIFNSPAHAYTQALVRSIPWPPVWASDPSEYATGAPSQARAGGV
jgi:ABC-type dipeptide/oligopeptide/nickel transport system ATPase component